MNIIIIFEKHKTLNIYNIFFEYNIFTIFTIKNTYFIFVLIIYTILIIKEKHNAPYIYYL